MEKTKAMTNALINTWRPCDGVETAYAWKHALESKDLPVESVQESV